MPTELVPAVEVVCGVIQDPAGRFLACRRPLAKALGGMWEFPGGKVEAGELPEAALARELREELGVEVEVNEALALVDWSYPTHRIQLMPYRCRILGGEARPIEHDELCWCRLDELRNLDWAAADVPVVDELICRNL